MGANKSKLYNSDEKRQSTYVEREEEMWLSDSEMERLRVRVYTNTEDGTKFNLEILNVTVSEYLDSSMCPPFQSMIFKFFKPDSTSSLHPLHAHNIFYLQLKPNAETQTRVLVNLTELVEDDEIIPSSNLLECVAKFTKGYCQLAGKKLPASRKSDDLDSYRVVAKAWLHDLLYDGATFKQSRDKEPLEMLPREAVHKWVKGHSGLYIIMQLSVMRKINCPDLDIVKDLFPKITMPKDIPLPLSLPQILLLNTSLPPLLRCEWRLLFSNTCHGDSFSLLMKHITNAGPTLIIIEDEDSNLFGGFASANWEVRPQFHGTAESFLFSLHPTAGVYHTTGYNSNYMYLNFLRDNTMPNGLGMGGREELFGFFLSSDFGECQVAPTCSTFSSPPLCPNQNPKVKYLTVWGVGEEPVDSDDDDEDGGPSKQRSALDKNVEARAMLDMLGKGRASDGLREPEPDED